MSFVDDAFVKVFFEWLDYKRLKKQKYQNQKSLRQCYNNLLKLSKGNPDTARLIVENSIGNNYAGLFELKQNKYESTSKFRKDNKDTSDSDIHEQSLRIISRLQAEGSDSD